MQLDIKSLSKPIKALLYLSIGFAWMLGRIIKKVVGHKEKSTIVKVLIINKFHWISFTNVMETFFDYAFHILFSCSFIFILCWHETPLINLLPLDYHIAMTSINGIFSSNKTCCYKVWRLLKWLDQLKYMRMPLLVVVLWTLEAIKNEFQCKWTPRN